MEHSFQNPLPKSLRQRMILPVFQVFKILVITLQFPALNVAASAYSTMVSGISRMGQPFKGCVAADAAAAFPIQNLYKKLLNSQ
jgi:hypothetical protein